MSAGIRKINAAGQKIIRAVSSVVKSLLGDEGDPCCCGCCVLFEVFWNCLTSKFSVVQLVDGSLDVDDLTYLSCDDEFFNGGVANVWVKDEAFVPNEGSGHSCRWIYKKPIDCGVAISPGDFPEPPANADDCDCPTPANNCVTCGVCCFSNLLSRLAITGLSFTYSGAGAWPIAYTAALNAMDLSAMVANFYPDTTTPGSEYLFASGVNGPSWWAWSAPFTWNGNTYRITLAAWIDCATGQWYWLAEVHIRNTTTGRWEYQDVIARSLLTGDAGDCCGVEFTGEDVDAAGGFGGVVTSSGATGEISNNNCCGIMVEVLPGVWERQCSDANTGDCVTGDCP